MNARARAHATYKDVLSAPDHLIAELIDGELHTSPRPRLRHSAAASGLFGNLYGRFRDGGGDGWVFLFEPELHLDDDVVVPDLAGWRRERMPEVPDAAAAELPPDWLCEVLSPSTARLDRVKKLPLYARHRVPHVWFLNIEHRSLDIFRLGNDGLWQLAGAYAGAQRVHAEPFETLELNLADIFGPDPEPDAEAQIEATPESRAAE